MDGSILIVEDDEDTRTVLAEALARRGFSTIVAPSAAEAMTQLREGDVDAVLADIRLAGASGLDLCAQVAESRPDVPVIVITAHGNMETVVAAIRAGAYDFVEKPVVADALALLLGRAVEHRRLKGEVRRLRGQVEVRRPSGILGDGPAMRRMLEVLEQVSTTDTTVLVTGESGTGKELVARAVHERSPRSGKRFSAVNCAAMPATLLESELFGHVRGAFTDAKRDRRGLFLEAEGGTLFLDEIGEMPAEMQAKLLRVLQERTVRPVGGDEEVPFDVRLVCATNRDLETEVEEGRFRQDLYYRVNVVHIEVPPLRARQSDILVLAQHFLAQHVDKTGKRVRGISAPAAKKLLDYDWPGNVRELENCLERAVALTRTSDISVDDLPDRVREYQGQRLILDSANPEEIVTLEEMERRYIRRVLAACNGNKSQAARVLGMDRRSLYRRLESLGETTAEGK